MKGRVVSGYRPSGRLHLGHFHGNLKKMVELQDTNECFFFVADWHALTTDYRDTSRLGYYTTQMVLDWLAAGLDPGRSTIYRQSDVLSIAELFLYFSMITTLGELERCPTYKDQLRELETRMINTYGFLGYPVLQAADILGMDGELVPVGEDQLPHLEITREIARRFNSIYGDVFPEPQPILSKAPRIPGTDGRKMSKSYMNHIGLEEGAEEIKAKVRKMITDPARMRRKDKGHPEVCSVFEFYGAYPALDAEALAKECREAGIGCTDCKDMLGKAIAEEMAPFRERREELSKKPQVVADILAEGSEHAREIAGVVVADARRAMNLGSL